MATSRSRTACLLCQCHASVSTRRRVQHGVQRTLQTATLRHGVSEQTVSLNATAGVGYDLDAIQSITDVTRKWTTHIPMADVRAAVQSLEAIVELRDRRQEVLRNLSKAKSFQEVLTCGEQLPAEEEVQLPDVQTGPISHETYRNLMRQETKPKSIRHILRAQLLQVRHPQDLLRVAAVAMQSRSHAEQLATVYEPIMRALYRCRETVTDAQVLSACNTIIARQRFAGIVPHYQLLTLGMKLAARCRGVAGMKRYLKLVHERSNTMTSHLFRSVIAKFSIGHRGLGEIRNGRWRRADLMQVLTGFDDCKHLPPKQQFHFGVFLDRTDWQYLHGWIAVLARCRASDEIWTEWLLWKQNPARTNPKLLKNRDHFMNTRRRGDHWFVEQMTYTGDLKLAWCLLEESAIAFSALKTRIKIRLLDGIEHARIWTPDMTAAMLEKYDADLIRIERAFGVTWEAGTEDGEGQHVLFRDQEDVLDELGAQDWKAENDFGFMTDGDEMVLSTQERYLHEAAEGDPVRPSHTRGWKIQEQQDNRDLRILRVRV
jgi:hypothetical protein